MSEHENTATANIGDQVGKKAIPSHAQLIKAVIIAICVATLLLVTTILPAEYGIDPTGTGRLMGLTGINEASSESGGRQITDTAPALSLSLTNVTTPYRSDITTVTLAPGKGTEVKATIGESQVMTFEWSTDTGVVSLDMHGEPPGDGSNFTSHRKGREEASAQGIFVAPFSGTHGWWWANKTNNPITVTLKTSGFYSSIGQR